MEQRPMKPFAQDFTYDQFQFHQIARIGDVALMAKRKWKHSRSNYEVVIIQHHPAQIIHGHEYPARESMPPSESWGVLGWSYVTEESAVAKFNKLVCKSVSSPQTPPMP